jgi:hypothetical protein
MDAQREDWRDRLICAVVAGAATALAGWGARRLAHLAWRRVTGRAPPQQKGLAAVLGWKAGHGGVGAALH